MATKLKQGRPFKDVSTPLNYQARVILNRKEYDLILAFAQKEGVSFSQFARDAIADYLTKKGYVKTKPQKQGNVSVLPDLI